MMKEKEVVVMEQEEIEGYSYCESTKQRCLNDCIGGGPVLSSVN